MQYLFDRLEDQASRDLLVKLAAFRLMGHRRVKLPRNNDEFWQNENRIATLPAVADPVQVEFMNLALTPRDLGPIGYDARLFGTARGIAMVYLQRQYDLERLGGICRVVPGDVVLDAGGCWGDTAVYFAERTGPSGKVVVFEFIPSNLVMLRRNLDLNPQLKDRVTVVDRPLWSVPGQELFYVDWGPGSRVSFNKLREDFPDTKTCTTTIDNFVDQSGLERVDFIKMDIEGAEPYALRGAERTIRKHRPKLAVSLYHSIDDFNSIPRVIDGFDLGYRFYLEHHTIYENETVLFCIPEGRAG
ncbi:MULTISPECIES: FkbM family methyltransferase [unclassified Bradyrhizobium]|uniref:FkbM family methyltransferase n=1 Tax=unclassified Bradyrhizobium TaxID=2631580 RepID=UPI0028E2762F|nr:MULTISPECIES: FkbM family methyltransferase [unclassified Bradyrhizobium]